MTEMGEKAMGRFFSTVHIKNNSSKKQFLNSFCNIMKKRDLMTCSEDKAIISYALAFSESGKWVTLTSDSYRDRPKQAKIDAKQTAAEMKTSSFSTDVVDSDWANIELYTGTDIHDTVIVGRSEFPDDPPKGRCECWEPLLVSGKTWEQLSEIWNKNEVFVEDALCGAASMLGIEPKYMISDYKDFNDTADKDTNVVSLFFKKKITAINSGEKKLTMNAAFKQIFGEALEPMGFVKAKTKYPYYIRFVDNSFLQIIGLKKEKENIFNIIAGIATIYRPEIDLNCSPRMNCNWLIGVSEIYQRCHSYDHDKQYRNSIMHFGFRSFENENIINAFKIALGEVEKWVLPEFEKMQTLYDVIDYLITVYIPGLDVFGPDVQFYRHVDDRDGLLCFELDDPYEIADKRAENSFKQASYMAEQNKDSFTEADYTKLCEDIKQYNKERKEYIGNILNNKDLYDETMAEIRRRKEKNIEILRVYGLEIK